MKITLRAFSLLLAVSMVLAVIPFTASAASLSQMKIVAFGDSLTHYGATDTGNNDAYGNKIYSDAYPDYLGSALGTTIVNAGVGGNTTDMALNRMDDEVIAENPNIVLVCFGMNDQAYNSSNGLSITPLERYRANLEKFVRDIKAAGGDVVFLTPNPVCDAEGYFTFYGDPNYNYGLLPSYCNAMRQVAIANGCGLVDLNYEFSLLSNMTEYMATNDGVHQNDKGRRLYAELVEKYLRAAYENTNKAQMTVRCVDENNKILAEYPVVGASGANITLSGPQIGGYTVETGEIKTSFVNGTVHTFRYYSNLAAYIEQAKFANARDYDAIVAMELQYAYNEAMELLFAAVPDFDAMETAAYRMKNLLAAKGETEFILSTGASYTTTAPNYYQWDSVNNCNSDKLDVAYADDGLRLTDGSKSNTAGGCSFYSAWTSNAEIIVDLGEVYTADVFRGYFASDEWGVAAPTTMTVSYYADYSWKTVEGKVSVQSVADGSAADVWGLSTITVTTDAPITSDKIKFNIPVNGYFVWVDEVEVALRVNTTDKVINAIDGVNTTILGDDTRIFTGTVGENANLRYTANIIAKWDVQKNAYIITDVFTNTGTAETVKLASDEILVASHTQSEIGYTNYYLLQNAKIGQAVYFNGVDLVNGVAIAATFEIVDYTGTPDIDDGNNNGGNNNGGNNQGGNSSDPVMLGDVNNSGAIDMMDYILLKRNYFGTFEFSAEQLKAGDVNNSGAIDMMDYILLKRVYFGTFTIS